MKQNIVPEKLKEGLARISDACEFLAMSRSSVYKLMDSGELRFAKIGKSRRVAWEDLRSLVERCLVGR